MGISVGGFKMENVVFKKRMIEKQYMTAYVLVEQNINRDVGQQKILVDIARRKILKL